MCGICGEIRFDHQQADPGTLALMTEALRERGPDAVGTFAQGRLGFGHRRLKIIDVSEAAQRGDTEVVLKAFHAWSRDCVARFNRKASFVPDIRVVGLDLLVEAVDRPEYVIVEANERLTVQGG